MFFLSVYTLFSFFHIFFLLFRWKAKKNGLKEKKTSRKAKKSIPTSFQLINDEKRFKINTRALHEPLLRMIKKYIFNHLKALVEIHNTRPRYPLQNDCLIGCQSTFLVFLFIFYFFSFLSFFFFNRDSSFQLDWLRTVIRLL